MTVRRGLSLFAALPIAALTLAACDGASPAGGDLIGQGGDPVADSLAVTALSTTDVDDYSGGSSLGSSATQGRMLVGDVVDPSFGNVRATAYVDFARPAMSDEFSGSTPTAVALILPVGTYAYGDTSATSSIDVEIAQVDEEWTASATDLDPGQEVRFGTPFTTVSVVPGDSTYTVDFPASWIAGTDSLLTGSDYAEAFEGFAIVPTEASGAVRGISATNVRLRVVAGGDTLVYFASEVYSRIEAPDAPEAEGLTVRDGSGQAISVDLPLDDVTLLGSAINQARLVLELDTTALQQDGLFRPVPGRFTLLGVRADSSRSPLANAAVSDGALSFSGSTVRNVIQQELFDTALFERYEIEFLNTEATVDVAPIRRADLLLVRVPPID